MEWVETTGRTIDEALDAALDELGVDEEDVEFEVLQEPKSGVFGIGRAEAHPSPGEADLAGEAGRAPASTGWQEGRRRTRSRRSWQPRRRRRTERWRCHR